MTGLLVTLLLLPRPVLSGPEALLDSSDGYFKVHYTVGGTDAPVHLADAAPRNGVPDDVDALAAGLAAVTEKWVKQVGMRAPLPDDGTGGDTRIDVYLHRLGGERGDTWPVGVGRGAAESAWIELDPRSAAVSAARLAAAAGHEAHHAIQYAYRSGAQRWIEEASAAYVEHADFSDAALALETDAHWTRVLTHPEAPLDRADGVHEYDELVFVKFLVDEKRDPARLRALWEAIAASPDAVTAIESPSVEGRPIAEVLAEFGRWNLHACAGEDGHHYEAAAAACHAQVGVSPIGLGVVPSSRAVPLAPLAIAYLGVPVDRCHPALLALTGAGGTSAARDDGTPVIELAGPSATLAVAGEGPGMAVVLASGRNGDARLAVAATAESGPSCADGGTAGGGKGAAGRSGCSSSGRGGDECLDGVCLAALLCFLWARRSRADRRGSGPWESLARRS